MPNPRPSGACEMDLIYWYLLTLLIIIVWTIVIMLIWSRWKEQFEKRNFSLYGPFIMWKTERGKKFIEKLRQKGIQISIHYPPVHQFTYYKKIFKTSKLKLPIAEQIGAREVTLPLHPLMNVNDVQYVYEQVRRIL